MKIFEKYRAKALACEELAKEVRDYELRCAWAEIAIEWKGTRNQPRSRSGKCRHRSEPCLTGTRVRKAGGMGWQVAYPMHLTNC
jgi:hypothetical protein